MIPNQTQKKLQLYSFLSDCTHPLWISDQMMMMNWCGFLSKLTCKQIVTTTDAIDVLPFAEGARMWFSIRYNQKKRKIFALFLPVRTLKLWILWPNDGDRCMNSEAAGFNPWSRMWFSIRHKQTQKSSFLYTFLSEWLTQSETLNFSDQMMVIGAWTAKLLVSFFFSNGRTVADVLY